MPPLILMIPSQVPDASLTFGEAVGAETASQ